MVTAFQSAMSHGFMKNVPYWETSIVQQETSGFEPASRLGGRGYSVKEGFGKYGYTEFDPDPDPDPDSDFDKI